MLAVTDKLPNREYLTIGETIVHTGLSRRAILSGKLPAYMAHGEWRVPTRAVRAYMEWQRDGLPPADTATL